MQRTTRGQCLCKCPTLQSGLGCRKNEEQRTSIEGVIRDKKCLALIVAKRRKKKRQGESGARRFPGADRKGQEEKRENFNGGKRA